MQSPATGSGVCLWVKDPVTGEIKVPWDFLPGYFTKIPEMYDKDKWLDTRFTEAIRR